MPRTIPFVAMLGVAVLGPVLACWGSPREALVPGQIAPVAEPEVRQASPARQEDGIAKVRAEPRPAHPLQPQMRPVPRDRESALRPQVRPFMARGPLVARLSFDAFGPRARPADLLVPDPPPSFADAGDLLCIAVAIYHEARDQPLDGQLAVASVILNRMQEPERWGETACEVVVPGQFSFMDADGSFPPVSDRPAWEIALEMAREALERGPSALVGQADHYHAKSVDPDWNQDMRQVIRIDDHVFFLDPATRG